MATPKKRGPHKKTGRKTKYRHEYVLQASQLIADGKNQRQCQDFFGVSRQTWITWKKRYPEFLDALNSALEGKVKNVVDALYKKALGYTFLEVSKSVTIDGTKKKIQSKKETSKEVPADVGAIKFFLTNRDPDNWQSLKKEEITGPNGGPISLNIHDDRAKLARANLLAQSTND